MSDIEPLKPLTEYEAFKAQAKAATEAKDFEEALLLYQQALDLKPECPDALVDLGNAYSDLKHYDKANDLYHKALAIQPDSWRALHNIGNGFRRNKDYIQAIKWFKQAREASPKECFPPFNLGRCYKGLGMGEQAESYFREALSNDRTEFACYLLLSQCLYEQDKVQAALDLLLYGQVFLSKRPELEDDNHSSLGYIYFKLHQPELAIKSYQNYLNVFKEKDAVYNHSILYLGKAYLENKQYNEALSALESLFYNIDSEYKEGFYLALAKTYEALEDYPYACGYYSELARLYPDDEYYNWKAGQLCKLNKSIDLALMHFEKCIVLAPSSVSHWQDKAYCLLVQAKLPEAISFINEALITWPNERYLTERLAEAYCEAKEPDLTLAWIAKVESFGNPKTSLECMKACSYFLKNEIETAIAVCKNLVSQPNWQDECHEWDLKFLLEQLKLNGIPDFESLAQL